MRTIYYLFSCLLIAGFATWAYQVNYATRAAAARVAALEAGIELESERIDVLAAEWAYLNRPERLLRLAEANFETLGLVPMRPEHFAKTEQVAYPLEAVDDMVRHAIMTSSGGQ